MTRFDDAIEVARETTLETKRKAALAAVSEAARKVAEPRLSRRERARRDAQNEIRARALRLSTSEYHRFLGGPVVAIFGDEGQSLCDEFIETMHKIDFPLIRKLVSVEHEDSIPKKRRQPREVKVERIAAQGYYIGKGTKVVKDSGYWGSKATDEYGIFLCSDGLLRRVFEDYTKSNYSDYIKRHEATRVEPFAMTDPKEILDSRYIHTGYEYYGELQWPESNNDFPLTVLHPYRPLEFRDLSLEDTLTRLAIVSAGLTPSS